MSVDSLDLADFLAISELVLGQTAEDIAFVSRLELAESALHAPGASFGDVEFYPDLVVKAAVLCTRIVKNHPLPDGNKRVGFVCMVEFCLRNGLTWTPPPATKTARSALVSSSSWRPDPETRTRLGRSPSGSGKGRHLETGAGALTPRERFASHEGSSICSRVRRESAGEQKTARTSESC